MKKLFFFAAIAMLILTGCSKKQSIYDFSVKDIEGKEVSMSQYKGKVLLIVNVASSTRRRSSATCSHRFIRRLAPDLTKATPSNGISGSF